MPNRPSLRPQQQQQQQRQKQGQRRHQQQQQLVPRQRFDSQVIFRMFLNVPAL